LRHALLQHAQLAPADARQHVAHAVVESHFHCS
jgi:hypothetical protein